MRSFDGGMDKIEQRELLDKIQFGRKRIVHANSQCFDSRFCLPHGEQDQAVNYNIEAIFKYILELENALLAWDAGLDEAVATNYMFESKGRIIANVKSQTKPRVVGVIEGDTMYSFYDGVVTIFATELEER